MYSLHPSNELKTLFKGKPYQGQNPEIARYIFLGRDANYSEKISEHPFFECILDYHDNGVRFWQKHGVHHPFLLSSYPFDRVRGGVKYHSTFAKMDLGIEFAPTISFVELLNVPTIGVTGKDKQGIFDSLLDKQHLEYLDSLMSGEEERIFFISPSVLSNIRRIWKRYGVFKWSREVATPRPSLQQPILVLNSARIYLSYHFSDCHAHAQLPDMAKLIRESKIGISVLETV